MNKLKTKLYLTVNCLTSFHRLFRVHERLKEKRISSVVSSRAVRTLTKQLRNLQLSRLIKSEVKYETRKENCRIVYATIPRR